MAYHTTMSRQEREAIINTNRPKGAEYLLEVGTVQVVYSEFSKAFAEWKKASKNKWNVARLYTWRDGKRIQLYEA